MKQTGSEDEILVLHVHRKNTQNVAMGLQHLAHAPYVTHVLVCISFILLG